MEQAAEALGLSRTHAYRLWTFARAWLYSQLAGGGGTGSLIFFTFSGILAAAFFALLDEERPEERRTVSVDFAKMQKIFLAAVEQHRPEDWAAYLDQACRRRR